MKCPHCNVEVNPHFKESPIENDSIGYASIFYMKCPNTDCGKFIIDLVRGKARREVYQNNYESTLSTNHIEERRTLYPFLASRPLAPIEVDTHIAKDYNESCAVFSLSPKASAALSRRCLQNILREKANVKKGDLVKEIQDAIANGLPTYISESVDAIRNIGNFAAHPSKDKVTGEIVEVEPGEAEWLLDVLELLFDFYYVQPELAKKKKTALDLKLAAIGKPPMK